MGNRNLYSAPLHVQAQQLKRSLENREKRRNSDRDKRTGETDVYEEEVSRHRKKTNDGGVASAVAALSAISAASAHQQPTVTVCELCKATFTSDVQYRQHVAGPVHRKAVEKQRAELERQQRMSVYNDQAEAALGAAAWTSTHGQHGSTQQSGSHRQGAGQRSAAEGTGSQQAGGPPGAAPRHVRSQQQQQQAREQQQRQQGTGGRQQLVPSHAELVAQAHAEDGPLSIDGWVPPSVVLPAAGRADDESYNGTAPRRTAVPAEAVQEPAAAKAAAQSDSDSEGPGGGVLGLAYSEDDEQGDGKEAGKASQSESEDGDDGPVPVSFF